MNPLNIEVEVFVLQFEWKQQEGYGVVSKLHQFWKAEVPEGSPQPKNELHQFEFRVYGLFEDEVKCEGVDQT